MRIASSWSWTRLASDHQLLQKCPIDVFINIASMQEMDPPVVKAYFDDMRAVAVNRQLLFYCCNRQEKQLPDGTVSRFADYPWRLGIMSKTQFESQA